LAAVKEPLLDMAIYHCQQAAEKTVKGWLQSQDDSFPRRTTLKFCGSSGKVAWRFHAVCEGCGGLNALRLGISLPRRWFG
jgi:hypothetical protein